MKNRQFVYTRLKGLETIQTAGTYGVSMVQIRVNRAKEEVKHPLVLVEEIVEEEQQQEPIIPEYETRYQAYVKQLEKERENEAFTKYVREEAKRARVRHTTKEVKKVTKLINPFLKPLGLKVKDVAVAELIIDIEKRLTK